MIDFEKLGTFYLGRLFDQQTGEPADTPVLYDAKDLTTRAVCVGMTGSGKTGLCLTLLEEAAIDGIPALCIDPKGDWGNLLLSFPELRPWSEGLASWGQDGKRISRFRDAVDLAIYTPGSSAGRPLRVLDAFAPPSGADVDADWKLEELMSAVSSLLALIGIEPDPVNSKEHILLSNLLSHAWDRGEVLGLDESESWTWNRSIPRPTGKSWPCESMG